MDSNPTSLRGGATDCHSKRLVLHMIASCLEKLEQTKRKNLMFICQSDMHQTFYWNKLEITVSTFTFCKRVLHNTNRTKQTWSAEQRQRTATLADDTFITLTSRLTLTLTSTAPTYWWIYCTLSTVKSHVQIQWKGVTGIEYWNVKYKGTWDHWGSKLLNVTLWKSVCDQIQQPLTE